MPFTTKTLFMMEDSIMQMPGLYAMWTACFIAALSALGVDTTTGSSRDFLLITTVFSTLYCALASYNTIYGNGKPSSMLLIAGPIHQFTFWLMLAYYRADVYGSHPIGVLNIVNTVLVSVFNLDLIIKTWLLAVTPKKYLDYLSNDTSSVIAVQASDSQASQASDSQASDSQPSELQEVVEA